MLMVPTNNTDDDGDGGGGFLDYCRPFDDIFTIRHKRFCR